MISDEPKVQQSVGDVYFIYIHGTNKNTEEEHQDFNVSVDSLHPLLMTALQQDPLVQSHLLNNGQWAIHPMPIPFYWGDQSRTQADILRSRTGLDTSLVASRVRNIVAGLLHDAVWLEDAENQSNVSTKLFSTIMEKTVPPHNTVLLGHSAGSLLTFEFLMHRLPYVNLYNLAQKIGVDPEVVAYLETRNPPVYTSLDALLEAEAIRIDGHGKIVPFLHGFSSAMAEELVEFRNRHLDEEVDQIIKYTQSISLPPGSLQGVVTFGSPILMFFSTAFDPDSTNGYLLSNMLQYMLDQKIFWLHVNHERDPFGIPIGEGKNPRLAVEKLLRKPAQAHGGFMISYTVTQHWPTVLSAHGWYWKKPEQFSDALVKAYNEAYHAWYPDGRGI